MFTERAPSSNAKVSDRSQPSLMFDLSVSQQAGSGSLHRLVGEFGSDWSFPSDDL
jgi:hypothetical protein